MQVIMNKPLKSFKLLEMTSFSIYAIQNVRN
jgi:hypothetical protein